MKIQPLSPEDFNNPGMEKRLNNKHEIVKWINSRLMELLPFTTKDVIPLVIPSSNDYLIKELLEEYRNLGWKIDYYCYEGRWEWKFYPVC